MVHSIQIRQIEHRKVGNIMLHPQLNAVPSELMGVTRSNSILVLLYIFSSDWNSYKCGDLTTYNVPVKSYFFSKAFPPKVVCQSNSFQHRDCSQNLDMKFNFNQSTDEPWKFQRKRLQEQTYILLYIHIIHNANIDRNGAVTSGGLDSVPFQC